MKKKENKFKIRAHVQLEYFRTFDLCGVFLLCILKPKKRLESNNLLKSSPLKKFIVKMSRGGGYMLYGW